MASTISESKEITNFTKMDNFIEVKCNWEIKSDKQLKNCISTIPESQAPECLSLDNIVSLESCVALFSKNENDEPCMIDIKLTKNLKIKRIAIVSEATVLEFFKQYGEYSSTQFTEFVDEFEDQSVFIGETTIDVPTSEATIKFTKTKRKNPEMWLYGIKLILTDVQDNTWGSFNFDVINAFLSNSKFMTTDKTSAAIKILNSMPFSNNKELPSPSTEDCVKKIKLNSDCNLLESNESIKDNEVENKKIENKDDYKKYIDNKFEEIEQKLNTKLEEMELRTNTKLDAIIAILNSNFK